MKKLLVKSEVPDLFVEPYITSAYRKPFCGPLQCIKYAFTLHNDVGNFWTHFLTLVIWITWLLFVMQDYDLSSDYYGPLLWCWIGCCSYAFFSSFAHMFSPLSEVMYHVCFMLDYTGISMYMYGGGVAYYYYERPLTLTFYSWEGVNIGLQVMVTMMALVFSCLSRFFWRRYRYTIRAMSFAPPFFINITPVILRWFECQGEECVLSSLPYHAYATLFTFLTVLPFVTKMPERLAPGKFDIFFQSHQLFHVSAAITTTSQMKLLLLDSRGRQEILTKNAQQTGIFPSASKLYSLFFIIFAVKLCVVILLGVLLKMGIVKDNKRKDVKHPKSS
ncbi:membrane progestin receptor gamma-like [Dysidea avara]|uniref:membrane progestin receptor gamma-like n=1 Tax=Dysidea avara TaxID=196820 RepID=UPI00332D45E5